MMKNLRLSHSKVQKYLQCPRSYKLYYNEKLREKSATSYLAFGSAMDEALNAILKAHNTDKKVDYKAIFDDNWQTIRINNRTYNLIDCTLVGYAKADFCLEILEEDDLKFAKAKILQLTPKYADLDLKELKTLLEERRANRFSDIFYEEENKALNILNWLSLRRKAFLMLDAYVKDILPSIEKVVDVQKKIELTADDGTELVGYIDAVVKFKGREGNTVLDNKTASQPYDRDKVKNSEQLSLYAFALGLDSAAYAVMCKAVKLNKQKKCNLCGFESEGRHKTCSNEVEGKRCGGEWTESVTPEITTQLLVDNITEKTKDVVIENIGEVAAAIQANIFPKNLSTCGNMFGQPCPYIGLCWRDEQDNLEVVEDVKK